MLLDEFIDSHKNDPDSQQKGNIEDEEIDINDLNTFINQWSKEFDRLNPDPEDNSDFDSDNDINPLDTLTPAGKYVSSKQL